MIKNYPLSIPKAIEECVTKVRTAMLAQLQEYDPTIVTISFMSGNITEVCEKLQEKSDNSIKKLEKFPVIILLEDIVIDRRNTNYYGVTRGMEIIIANHTLSNYSSMEREDKNFAKILRPLYQNLIYQLANSRVFAIPSEKEINHTVAERKYWGADSNTKNVLGDYIDAIHMQDIAVPIRMNYCYELLGAD